MTKLKAMTLNVRGLAMEGKFLRFCQSMYRWVGDQELHVACLQEHNLDPKKKAEYIRIANDYELELAIGFSDSEAHRGGTLILSAATVIQCKKITLESSRITRAQYDFHGTDLDIASVYAPAKPFERIDFLTTLHKFLSPTTITGGDWNCVPDILLDVKGDNATQYKNFGGAKLNQVMADLTLLDYRRTQLEDKFEHTHLPTKDTDNFTRLDRWYIPQDSAHSSFLWNIYVRNDLVWSTENSDHKPVILIIEPVEGERGNHRPNIREDLLYTDTLREEIMKITDTAYEGPAKPYKKWEKAMNCIQTFLIKKTNELRKKEAKEQRQTRDTLAVLNAKMNKLGATSRDIKQEKELKEHLYKLQHPEAPHLASEARAKAMTDRSESCSKTFFKPYKDLSKQSWINEIHKATWAEDQDPVISGTVKDPRQIAGELAKYYKMLYDEKTIEPAETDRLIQKFHDKRIQQASADMLEREIQDSEVQEIMDRLPLRKQAGPNRIPNALYRSMSFYFAPKLAKVLRQAIKGTGKLPKHFMEGDITIVHKKNTRLDPRNYRPLTMLNTDYKIYTKVLANRMKKVVHEFVSSPQKGFVPDVFIAECTMMLTLIENYINENPEERQGAFLFLDMEKAFDRVSYQFLNKSMEAVGFGPNFRNAVGMMYNVTNPPRRRVLANGYYSSWFELKSGVPQGCPLSPLIFLFVAEALKNAVDMETGIKGIKVGDKYYKISQFADDTTLLLGKLREIKLANRAIDRWCRATGMRENTAKREGLAMGRLRNAQLPEGISWAKDGKWVRSLGAPIGNDLPAEKWWTLKIEEVRNKSRKWTALFRTGYFGRNLIVQSMYLGRLRYWFYSVPMTKKIRVMIQNDSDILWWAKEPVLGGDPPPRFRRFVGKLTAPGPRVLGGLGTCPTSLHIDAFLSQWITRYVDPSISQWKSIVDTLLHQQLSTEGRAYLFTPLSTRERIKVLKALPKNATYLRSCFKAHWLLDLKPRKHQEDTDPKHDPDDPKTFPASLPAEPIWRNFRFTLEVSKKLKKFCIESLKITRLSDLVSSDTRTIRTADDWLELVRARRPQERTWRGHQEALAVDVLGDDAIMDDNVDLANKIHTLFLGIPPLIRAAINGFMAPTEPKKGEIRWLDPLDEHDPPYGKYQGSHTFKTYLINQVGQLVSTGTTTHMDYTATYPVATWKIDKRDYFGEGDFEIRYLGPAHRTWPQPEDWMIASEPAELDTLSVRARTRIQAVKRMKPPASPTAWAEKHRLGPILIPWNKIWRIRSFFVTPRDQITWLKVHHRNLYLAGNNPDDPQCMVCPAKENILHLVRCSQILNKFWNPLTNTLTRMGFYVPQAQWEKEAFWLLGRLDQSHAVDKPVAGILFLAWRCLYAEIVRARVDGATPFFERALNRVWQMTITRLKAEGHRWRSWHLLNINTGNKSHIPRKYQDRIVIRCDHDAEYEINAHIWNAYHDTFKQMRDLEQANPQRYQQRKSRKRPTHQTPPPPPKRPKHTYVPNLNVPQTFRPPGPLTQTTLQFRTNTSHNTPDDAER